MPQKYQTQTVYPMSSLRRTSTPRHTNNSINRRSVHFELPEDDIDQFSVIECGRGNYIDTPLPSPSPPAYCDAIKPINQEYESSAPPPSPPPPLPPRAPINAQPYFLSQTSPSLHIVPKCVDFVQVHYRQSTTQTSFNSDETTDEAPEYTLINNNASMEQFRNVNNNNMIGNNTTTTMTTSTTTTTNCGMCDGNFYRRSNTLYLGSNDDDDLIISDPIPSGIILRAANRRRVERTKAPTTTTTSKWLRFKNYFVCSCNCWINFLLVALLIMMCGLWIWYVKLILGS